MSFKGPSGIAINQRNGNIVVSDTGNHQIQIVDENGHLLTKFGSYGKSVISYILFFVDFTQIECHQSTI